MAGLEYKAAGPVNPAVDPSCRTLYIADLPPYFDDVLLRSTFQGMAGFFSGLYALAEILRRGRVSPHKSLDVGRQVYLRTLFRILSRSIEVCSHYSLISEICSLKACALSLPSPLTAIVVPAGFLLEHRLPCIDAVFPMCSQKASYLAFLRHRVLKAL